MPNEEIENKYIEPAEPGDYNALILQVSETDGTFGRVYVVKVSAKEFGEIDVWVNKPSFFGFRTGIAKLYRNARVKIPTSKKIGLDLINKDLSDKEVVVKLSYGDTGFPVVKFA